MVMVDAIDDSTKPLPDCLRAVVTLRRAGFTYKDIAAQLHKPIGTIKQRIHRARNEFREEI